VTHKSGSVRGLGAKAPGPTRPARIVGHHPVQAPELTAGARLHLEWMNPPIAHGEVADFRRAAPHLHLQIRDAIHLFCFFSGGYD